MPAFGIVWAAAAVLLAAGGTAKLRRPEDAVRAFASSGHRLPAGAVRAVAALEVLVALFALLVGSRAAAALVAASYAAFTAVVAWTLARGGVLSSCGCFGRPDTPANPAHVIVTSGFTLVGALAIAHPPGPVTTHPDGVAAGVAGAGLSILVAWLAFAVIAVLPTVSRRARVR